MFFKVAASKVWCRKVTDAFKYQ